MRKSIWIGLSVGALLVTLALFGPGALTVSGAEPTACASCHVMEQNVDSFKTSESAHSKEISCSDCHLPHGTEGLVQKYKTGFRHVVANMSGDVPEELRLRPEDRQWIIDNCVRCHADEEHIQQNGKNSCLNCHSNIPHGERGEPKQ